MKLVILICLVSLLFLPSVIANADDMSDPTYGNGLFVALSSCPIPSGASFGKENGTDHEVHDCMQALGYIRGVADTLNIAPVGVTYGQDFDIVYTYLKNHVNQRQRLSVGLIREALVEAFPPASK